MILLKILSWIYGLIMMLRNFLYNSNIKKSFVYTKPTLVAVGNLTIGGTGKTPLVIYLTQFFTKQKSVAVLSRGYKRHSQGFKIIDGSDSSSTAGDEPYLYHTRFKQHHNVWIAVCKDRVQGIARIVEYKPNVDVIILDDAFQNRRLTPTVNILLTTFKRPFFEDHLLPFGLLRESRHGAKRADIILVTKTPKNIDEMAMDATKKSIQKYHPTIPSSAIFFTRMVYQKPIALWGAPTNKLPQHLLLITGIATPLYLKEYLMDKGHKVTHLIFKDHHWFSYKDVVKIANTFQSLTESDKVIVTTEKDSVRFIDNPWNAILLDLPMVYIPIEMTFLDKKQSDLFQKKIRGN